MGLAQRGFVVDHVITIDPDKGAQQKVAGYQDLRGFLDAHAIAYTTADRYSLKSDADRERVLALELDVLLVMGWQRLIPDWWLNALSVGAFGMHGSSKPLPHGRGRSPLNWSLIQGKDRFYTHLFEYLPGVDDGPVVGVQIFDITARDTCLTLHHKNTMAMIQLASDALPGLMDGTAVRTPQPTEGATYYPKRSAKDGLLHFEDGSDALDGLIRAVTYPFPGAFAYLDDDPTRQVMIWAAQPFDTRITWPQAEPGTIVQVFVNGSFIVRTGDGSLLVTQSEGHPFDHSDVGRRLGTAGTPRTRWANLPE